MLSSLALHRHYYYFNAIIIFTNMGDIFITKFMFYNMEQTHKERWVFCLYKLMVLVLNYFSLKIKKRRCGTIKEFFDFKTNI